MKKQPPVKKTKKKVEKITPSNPYEHLLKRAHLKSSKEEEKLIEEEINPYENLMKVMSNQPSKISLVQNTNQESESEPSPIQFKKVDLKNFSEESNPTKISSPNVEFPMLRNRNFEDESQTDLSLAEIYECLHENFKGRTPKKSSKSQRRFRDVTPKVYNKVNKEKIKEKVIKKHNLDSKKEESESKLRSSKRSRTIEKSRENRIEVVERLLKYGEENKAKKSLKMEKKERRNFKERRRRIVPKTENWKKEYRNVEKKF